MVQVSEINDSVFDVSWKQHRNLKYFSKQMNSLYKEEYSPPIKTPFISHSVHLYDANLIASSRFICLKYCSYSNTG